MVLLRALQRTVHCPPATALFYLVSHHPLSAKKKTVRKASRNRSSISPAKSGRRRRKSKLRPPAARVAAKPIALRPATAPDLPVYEMREARVREAVEADAEIYDSARTQWLMGDWDTLADFDLPQIAEHPKRAKLALLIASARHEVEDYDGAAHLLQQALNWGASKRDALGILIGQTHAALGRAALLSRQYDRAENHFHASITNILPNRFSARHAKDRLFKELLRLGLLQDAKELLDESLEDLRKRETSTASSELSIFATKLELLGVELSRSLQRGQIGPGARGVKPLDPLSGESSTHASMQRLATSQLGQDLWVLDQTQFKTGGYFVEFGATDGIRLSNTYLLEKSFGWAGLCAEPNPELFKQLSKNRSCTTSADCIGGESGRVVEFLLADDYGGIIEHLDDHNNARRKGYLDSGNTFTTTTISLDDFLRKHNAPRTIDYLSIDTEGSEYEILKNFPFDQWEVRLLTVEHNFTPMRQSIRELLAAKGYVCQEAQWDDWYKLTSPGNRD
jgi:FkbM family methyltransferase